METGPANDLRSLPEGFPGSPRRPWTLLVCDHRGGGLAERVEELASRAHEAWVTRSLRGSLDQIAARRPGVALVDPLVPGGGAELAALAEAGRREGGLPLLVVSEARSGAPSPLASLHALGPECFDTVERGAPIDELRLRLERLVDERRLRDEMRELRHRASHDDRTQCLRPAAFQERLSEHFSAAQRHRLDLALVLMDLDRFGQINKRYDHTVGDEVIARVGQAVRKSLRAEDIAGRLGGDEFAVVLPYTRRVDAARVVERLCTEVHRLSGPFPGAGDPLDISGSLGFETFDGADLPSVAKLRQNAERALREAKQAGGNRAIYFRELAAAT